MHDIGAPRAAAAKSEQSSWSDRPASRSDTAYPLVTLTIDELDARLIAALREQPRVGLLEISRRLGVARGTVQARLAQLEARGGVSGHGPEVDPSAMGYPISAFMLIELTQGRLAEAVERLAA